MHHRPAAIACSLLFFAGATALLTMHADAAPAPTSAPSDAPTTAPTSRPADGGSTSQPQYDEPAWSEFINLVGEDKDSPIVQAFINRYRLKPSAQGDSGLYRNPKEMPIVLIYTGNKIARVVLRINDFHPPGLTRSPRGAIITPEPRPIYHGDLGNGVRSIDHAGDVVRRLGAPTHQFELELVYYKRLGLTFKFDVENHRMTEVDIDQKPNDQEN